MWKVFLAFAGNRVFLFVVALLTINMASPGVGVRTVILNKVASLPESVELTRMVQGPPRAGRIFQTDAEPFLWINYLVVKATHLSPGVSLVILSNLFFCLFLWELYSLMCLMAMPDFAVAGTVLAVLWPASYELSMGSYYAMPCLFTVMTLRHAVDNRWLFSGLALGVLALMEPFSIALFPLLIYIFWYFQRHFELTQVLKRTAFFLVPACLAILWRYDAYSHLSSAIAGSSAFNLIAAAKTGQGLGWTFTHSYLGQTVSIAFFCVAAVLTFLSTGMLMHKLIPVTLTAILLAFSPYAAVASRALLAGPSLLGIASHSSRPVLGFLQTVLLMLGAYEIYALFAPSL